MEILNVKSLSFKYPLTDKNTLEDVSFTLDKGDFAVLCGQTGSGKTTLLRALKPSTVLRLMIIPKEMKLKSDLLCRIPSSRL